MGKALEQDDYRKDVPRVDKYGRRECDNCGKRRKVNVYWSGIDLAMCKECSHDTKGSELLSLSVASRWAK